MARRARGNPPRARRRPHQVAAAPADEREASAHKRSVDGLTERWNDAFHAWLDDAEALPEAQGLLVPAVRREGDAPADLAGFQGVLEGARADVADAGERLTAAERQATAADEVARAEAALERADAAV